MPVSENLLKILVCPESHQSLREASPTQLEKVNARIVLGKVLNRGGKPVLDALEAGLIREDGKVLYPIRNDIPMLLVDRSLEVGEL